MTPKLRALLRHIAPRVPSSTHLRIVAPVADFAAYGRLGEPLLDVTWRKGREFMYPDPLTEREWHRETSRIWRRARPLPIVLAGDAVALYALLKIVRPG